MIGALRARRGLALVVAAVALTGGVDVVNATTAGAAPPPLTYVHLGDSYAAGPGAGNYHSGGVVLSVSCYQSSNSYAELWAAEAAGKYALTFYNDACSAATTSKVVQTQLSHLSPATDRVTITIGGNDIGFSDIIKACRLPLLFPGTDCRPANANSRAAVASSLPGNLRSLFDAIRQAAPNAHVIATGYPRPYNATAFCGLLSISSEDRADVNETVQQLDGALADFAGSYHAQTGYDLTFASVDGQFEGHRLCDSSPYINDIQSSDWAVTGPAGIYHPNSAGHRYGFLEAVGHP